MLSALRGRRGRPKSAERRAREQQLSREFLPLAPPPPPPKPNFITIPWSDLTIEGRVASGSFGHVSKGLYNGVAVAVKHLHQRAGNIQELLEEVDTMRRLRHPNLLAMMGLTADPSTHMLGVIMEFLPATLHAVINLVEPHLSWDNCFLAIATDVAQGMHHLHLCNFVHRDLKPGNVLLSDGWVAKVADFGEVLQRESTKIVAGASAAAGMSAKANQTKVVAPTAASLAAAADGPSFKRQPLRRGKPGGGGGAHATDEMSEVPSGTDPLTEQTATLSAMLGENLTNVLTTNPSMGSGLLLMPREDRRMRIHGTLPFISPEGASAGTDQQLPVGPPTDVWAFGCVLAHMAVRWAPYTRLRRGTKPTMPKPAEVIQALRDGSARPLAKLTDDNIPPPLRDLAESCCRWSADARPTFGDVCALLSRAETVRSVCGPPDAEEEEDGEDQTARRPAIRLRWISECRGGGKDDGTVEAAPPLPGSPDLEPGLVHARGHGSPGALVGPQEAAEHVTGGSEDSERGSARAPGLAAVHSLEA